MKAWPILMAAFVLTAPVAAQDLATASIGTKFDKSATVYGRVLPVPPGSFELVSRDIERLQDSVHLANVTMISTVNGRLDTAIWLQANQEAHASRNWAKEELCSRSDLYFRYDRGDTLKEYECWIVSARHFDLHDAPTASWAEFLRRSEQVGRPNVMPFTFHQVVHNGGMIRVAYSYNAARWGLADDDKPWRQNAWRPANARKNAARTRVLQLLTDQGQALSDALKAGLDGRDVGFTWKLD